VRVRCQNKKKPDSLPSGFVISSLFQGVSACHIIYHALHALMLVVKVGSLPLT
jgi:hypothetical protein